MPQMPCPFPLAPPQVAPFRPAPRSHGTTRGGETALTVSIPLVALLGAVVFVAWR